jgi:hypothetical protein
VHYCLCTEAPNALGNGAVTRVRLPSRQVTVYDAADWLSALADVRYGKAVRGQPLRRRNVPSVMAPPCPIRALEGMKEHSTDDHA